MNTAAPTQATPPIGVFDSGIGGLSILRALRDELPHENFVYLADSAYAPYGERDEAYVLARARLITEQLCTNYRVKALVVACNTATAVAIATLRQEHPELPIIGVEPALKPALAQTQTGRVGVLATRGTLASQKFQQLCTALAGQADVACQPCDGLASAIEANDMARIQRLCASYTTALGPCGARAGDIDTVVLGCTHYPFATEAFRQLLGPDVTLLDSGAPVARQTRRRLEEHQALSTAAESGHITLLSTGDPEPLQSAFRRWL